MITQNEFDLLNEFGFECILSAVNMKKYYFYIKKSKYAYKEDFDHEILNKILSEFLFNKGMKLKGKCHKTFETFEFFTDMKNKIVYLTKHRVENLIDFDYGFTTKYPTLDKNDVKLFCKVLEKYKKKIILKQNGI